MANTNTVFPSTPVCLVWISDVEDCILRCVIVKRTGTSNACVMVCIHSFMYPQCLNAYIYVMYECVYIIKTLTWCINMHPSYMDALTITGWALTTTGLVIWTIWGVATVTTVAVVVVTITPPLVCPAAPSMSFFAMQIHHVTALVKMKKIAWKMWDTISENHAPS